MTRYVGECNGELLCINDSTDVMSEDYPLRNLPITEKESTQIMR